MSKERYIDNMTYISVSCGNVERLKTIGKKGETLDDVVTKLIDFYEDLRRQDWINIKSDENQFNDQVRNKRHFYSCLSNL